jgi:DNA-binding response OmpR family regulator
MAKIYLIGIDQSIAHPLSRAIAAENHIVESKSKDLSAAEATTADVIFAGGENRAYLPLLQAVRSECPAMPFVVVTRLPDSSDWLDALDAGATDYLAAPIEQIQLRWILESVLNHQLRMVAAA